MQVAQTAPSVATVNCYVGTPTVTSVAYFCAVPLGDSGTAWSGRSRVTGLSLAASVADATATLLRVCRYTPYREHRVVPGTARLLMRNDEHPLDYAGASVALVNQNFLVIRAGNGSLAYDCPDEDSSTPYVSGRSWHHQPAS